MTRNILVLIAIIVICTMSVKAQDNWNWPEDRKTAEQKNAYYSDLLKQKNYAKAVNPLYWLLVNAPDLNTSIYINGVKIYDALAKEVKKTDKERFKVLGDSVMLLYDLRVKYFDNQNIADIANRKAYASYKYWNARKEKFDEVMKLFGDAFALNGDEILDNSTLFYMDMVRRYKKYIGTISNDSIIDIYETITEVLEAKIEKAQDNEKIEKLEDLHEKVDGIFVDIMGEVIDCAFIENNFGSKFNESPTDIKLAKKVASLSLQFKCTDSPSFLKAAEVVTTHHPDFGLFKFIAAKYKASGKYNEAIETFKKAIEATGNNEKKADMYLELADVYSRLGQNTTSKNYANKAINTNSSSASKAYTIIGNLYFKSFEICKEGENMVHDRAVYIAAYDMYKKAGNTSAAANAKAQFPTIQDIFTVGMKEGDIYHIGCWIDTDITVQKRD